MFFFLELNELLTRELVENGYSGVEVSVNPMRTEIRRYPNSEHCRLVSLPFFGSFEPSIRMNFVIFMSLN
ncbi:hypothetical protein ACS0TY_019366 [Phlomoides rotata]